jgi:hypothetical protein
MDEKQARFLREWYAAWQAHLKREESLLSQLNTLHLRVATLEKALDAQEERRQMAEQGTQYTLWTSDV